MQRMWIVGALVSVLGACGGDDPAVSTDGSDTNTAANDTGAETHAGADGSEPSEVDATTGQEADIAPASACGAASVSETQTLVDLVVNGVARQYRLTVPQADAGSPLPVLLAFHGGDGRDWPFPQQDQFDALASESGFIVAYPLAELVLPNEGEWQLNTHDDARQDITFVEAIIDDLSSRACVDPTRVYATGYSLGSMFTYELACHLNTRFAAIASFAGTMPVSPHACVLEDNVAIMHLHGRADNIIPYATTWGWKQWDSVGTMMDVPSLVAFWADKNGCQTESDSQDGAVQHFVHDGCAGGVRVEHYAVDGQDHDWPNSLSGVSTHALIWDFLSSFSKP